MKYNYSREKIKWENEKILEEKLLKDNNIDFYSRMSMIVSPGFFVFLLLVALYF